MSVILIHGENEFRAGEFYKKTLAKFVSSNSQESLRVFDGESATPAETEEALSSQSLFSSGSEMVAIKRLGTNADLKDKLTELLDEIPDETQLIIYEPKIDKRSKLYKLLKKSGSTKEFDSLGEPELIKWINERVAKFGGQLEEGGAKLLVNMTKGNQLRLASEIDKLLNYDKTISLESIKTLVDKAPDDNIFELLDYVSRGDKKKALSKYEELSLAQVEAHYVLVMLCWQMANFISVKSGENKSDKEIASQLGMNPYAVSKTRSIVKNISKRQLESMTKKVLAVDVRLKSASLDADQLVKQLIVEL